ncbi:hypothetical protein NECAME_13465 [Necator americanus]|uniref:Uncharacterized protein n=1 Tax=Necator americanus TaxID=51031 RepID=W2SVS3_NECAM|nr:hypothetical protein NECAME_13465 [Necator americanus]ETN73745.1 hypothetical protein NECAME_13465 [Necator americanus]
MPEQVHERDYTDGEQRNNVKGRRSNGYGQQFASPYQNCYGSPNDSGFRRSSGGGSPAAYFRASQGMWQSNRRPSFGNARGTPRSSYKNKSQYTQQVGQEISSKKCISLES